LPCVSYVSGITCDFYKRLHNRGGANLLYVCPFLCPYISPWLSLERFSRKFFFLYENISILNSAVIKCTLHEDLSTFIFSGDKKITTTSVTLREMVFYFNAKMCEYYIDAPMW